MVATWNKRRSQVVSGEPVALPWSANGRTRSCRETAGLQALNQLVVVDWGKAAGVDDAPG